MSLFGTPSVHHAAGLTQAERVNARSAEAKKPARPPERLRRALDEVDLDSAQAADAVRTLKGNSDEETADDRQERDHYQPPAKAKAPERPRLDVQG